MDTQSLLRLLKEQEVKEWETLGMDKQTAHQLVESYGLVQCMRRRRQIIARGRPMLWLLAGVIDGLRAGEHLN